MINLTTKMIKKNFQEAFPEIKFSVRSAPGTFEEAIKVVYDGDISWAALHNFAASAMPEVALSLLFYRY